MEASPRWPIVISGSPLRAHTKIFIFADRYGIAGLSKLAHMRLSKRLVHHERRINSDGLTEEEEDWRNSTMTGMINFARFCFKRDTPQSLRELALLFLASEAKTLMKSTEFRTLLETYPELAVGLVSEMAEG